jgi:DNA-binding LytR/AlgR family response regulator
MIVRFYDRFKLLKQENETLLREKESLQQTVHDYDTDNLNKSIEFISDNINENVVLQLSDIILIKSADNYVEIIYQDGTEINRRIIRSTLKSVELRLKPYSSFIRCHRIAIVNRYHIQSINKKFGSYSLSIRDYEEDIPVSRQYLFKIKNLQ